MADNPYWNALKPMSGYSTDDGSYIQRPEEVGGFGTQPIPRQYGLGGMLPQYAQHSQFALSQGVSTNNYAPSNSAYTTGSGSVMQPGPSNGAPFNFRPMMKNG